jgi:hypothetical protein
MKKYTTFLTILCLLFAGTAFSQNHWRVNNAFGVDADFDNIPAAVDSASAGDIIYIEGTNIPYSTNFNIEKPLTLIGPGYFLASNDSTQANVSTAIISGTINLLPGSEGLYMAGLTINANLRISASNLIIERNNISTLQMGYSTDIGNVVIRQNYIYSIYDNNYYTSAVIKNNIVVQRISNSFRANWLIYNNTVYGSQTGTMIEVYNSSVKNNIVINTQGAASYDCIDTDPMRNNNIEFNVCNKVPYNQPELENNIWDADPALVFILDGNNETMLYLLEGSPAIGYGENGQDCGAYGDLTPYILSGMPPVPHIFKANVPVSATTTGGLPVNVKIKSQY